MTKGGESKTGGKEGGMEVMETIRDRVSVRAYEPRPVPEELVQQVVQAGVCAPSANNQRPWHIIAVRDAGLRERLAATHQWASFAAAAPVVLVVCGDTARSSTFWVEDTSAAAQNMLLAAHALGLGSCWIAIRGESDAHERAVRELLGIPPHVGVLALLPLGYPAQRPRPRPARDITPHYHRERW